MVGVYIVPEGLCLILGDWCAACGKKLFLSGCFGIQCSVVSTRVEKLEQVLFRV